MAAFTDLYLTLPFGILIAVFIFVGALIIWYTMTVYYAVLPIIIAVAVSLQRPGEPSFLWLIWTYPTVVMLIINCSPAFNTLEHHPGLLLTLLFIGATSFIVWANPFTPSSTQDSSIADIFKGLIKSVMFLTIYLIGFLGMLASFLPRSSTSAAGWGHLGVVIDGIRHRLSTCFSFCAEVLEPSFSGKPTQNKHVSPHIEGPPSYDILQTAHDTIV
ncbi:hypothetical protein FISHEDRAFT_55675 [Fistulina hepatica ATCC 64428]|uniref:Uncharacterized protein n=1 Tax=Fistulina hepatica ATCC 64428 TaxID=1128425 RepID=A0A0D7ALF2_9AGAR|nr:hypothetical protein FISHEDRAFT_55675 [Fistulina hepatica ATCC 64428]